MNELRDRLERELNDVPVAPRSASDIIVWADHRRRLHRIATVGLAFALTLGSVALITQAFDTSTGGSPGGVVKVEERIVFNTVPWPDIPAQLYSVRSDGTDLTQMTQPDADYLSPAVSPDGSRIAFVRFVKGSDPPRTAHEGIYVMRADGSEMRELLTTGEPNPISVSQIAWSPDGSKIAFIRIFYVGDSEGDFRHELWIMGADGSEPQRVVDRQIESFSWSPEGSRIAFAEQSVIGTRLAWDLYVMDTDGSNVERLTDDGRSRQPAWSPDGESVAFRSDDQIYVMNADGSQVSRLTTGRESFGEPTWSPDSSALAINAFDQETHRCSLLTLTLEGEVSTLLESHRPERRPGQETEPPLCAGTLAWTFLKTLEAPTVSGSLVFDHITITDPLNERSQVEAQAMVTWSGDEFPGVFRCAFIARGQAGKELGSQEEIVASLSTGVSFPVTVDASSAATSMDAECGSRLDVGTPYRYDFTNVRVTGGDERPGSANADAATVEYDADWAAEGQAGAATCQIAILNEDGAIVGSKDLNLFILEGSGTGLTTVIDVDGTPSRAEFTCSPFSG